MVERKRNLTCLHKRKISALRAHGKEVAEGEHEGVEESEQVGSRWTKQSLAQEQSGDG